MAATLKYLMVFVSAWIASVWPGAWTALLVLLGLSAMCLGMALEGYFTGRERRQRSRPDGERAPA